MPAKANNAKPSLWGRLRALFVTPRLPAWPVLIWEVLQWIPDWKSRADFWVSIAKDTGGFWGGVASVITLPYFNLGMTAAALLWLGLVGEPKKGVQRHPFLPYLGWGVFGIILAAIGSSIITGYFELRLKEGVNERDKELQKQYGVLPVFWHLTDFEKTNLGWALEQIPESDRFSINIQCLPDAGSRTFVEEISKVIIDHNWPKPSVNCMFSPVRPDLTGLYIGISPLLKGKQFDEAPKNLKTLVKVLNDAHISAQLAFSNPDSKEKEDEFWSVVGNAP
jgi:hypothetical protein